MFISSYSTYADINTSQKIQKNRNEESVKSSDLFSTKLLSKAQEVIDSSSKFPINYISRYKALNNQYKLQEKMQNDANIKFSKVKTISNAKVAYSDNSKIFSLLLKPTTTIDQTPKINAKMPKEAQNAEERIMKHTMVNTYIANENYYKITA